MAQFYTNTEEKKPNKKIIIIAVIAALIIITLIVTALIPKGGGEVSEEEAAGYIDTFVTNIRNEKYKDAYNMVQNNQYDEAGFINLMSTIQGSVELNSCTTKSIAPEELTESAIEVICPYKNKELNKELSMAFVVSEIDGKTIIDSYDIAYL